MCTWMQNRILVAYLFEFGFVCTWLLAVAIVVILVSPELTSDISTSNQKIQNKDKQQRKSKKRAFISLGS